MATLRQFIGNDPFTAAYRQFEIAVYNTNTSTVTNGGQCCCWVVPQGVTWAFFEAWGAGGDGAGACCCMGNYYGPGNGQYGRKFLAVTAGNYFTVCGAGSGCRSCCCCGVCGFPSFVLCANSTNVLCAGGGALGCTLCFRSYQACVGNCIPGCITSYNSPTSEGFCVGSHNSVAHETSYCWSRMWAWNSGAPGLANNTRHGPDYCCTQLTRSGEDIFQPKWPGGPGMNARACSGGCCYGGPGLGGLVTITYG